MQKKLIALILTVTLVCGTLPAAFGANIGATTQHLRRSKAPFHVGDDFTGYRQAVLESLTAAFLKLGAKENYFEGVWNEAKQLYSTERSRICEMSDINELVTPGFFGMELNDTTENVTYKLYLLSEMNKTQIKKASDLQTLKTALLGKINADIKRNYPRKAYNDYYWEKLCACKEQAVEAIQNAACFADFAVARDNWKMYFEEPDEDLLENPFEIQSEFVTITALENEVIALSAVMEQKLNEWESKGQKVYTDEVQRLLSDFEKQASKAPYIEKIYKLFENTWLEITEKAGIEEPIREPATVSDIRKACKRLNALYMQLNESDYTEYNWSDITDIYDEAFASITDAAFLDEVDDAFFEDLQKSFTAVQTIAQELKSDKKAAIATLKTYVGNKQYNQKSVKALYNEAVTKINAATTSEQVESLLIKYISSMEKTVVTFKITVSKSGKGAVSKSAKVKYGTNFTVKIVPTAGYKIKSITVDGKKVKLTNAYTFKKVTKAHSMKVTFGK